MCCKIMKKIYFLPILIFFSWHNFAQDFTPMAKEKIVQLKLDAFIAEVKQFFEEQKRPYAPIYDDYLLHKKQKHKEELERFVDIKILNNKITELLDNLGSNIDEQTYLYATKSCINSGCFSYVHWVHLVWFPVFVVDILLLISAGVSGEQILNVYAAIIAGTALLISTGIVITHVALCCKEKPIKNAIETIDFQHNNSILNKFAVREHLKDTVELLKIQILNYINKREISTHQSEYFYQFQHIYDEYIKLLDDIEKEIIVNNC